MKRSNTGKNICIIPCRKYGDFINNLNFLKLGNLKIVEYSIKEALKTKIFKDIYLISDDIRSCEELSKTYNVKFIFSPNNKNTSYEDIIIKNKKKFLLKLDNACVLLPNYPFKNFKTIKKIFKYFKENNLNFCATIYKENKFIYFKKNKMLKSFNYSKKIFKRRFIKPFFSFSGGIFFYKSFKKHNIDKLEVKNLVILNRYESFGINSLYDLILADSLVGIDTSILKTLLKKNTS